MLISSSSGMITLQELTTLIESRPDGLDLLYVPNLIRRLVEEVRTQLQTENPKCKNAKFHNLLKSTSVEGILEIADNSWDS